MTTVDQYRTEAANMIEALGLSSAHLLPDLTVTEKFGKPEEELTTPLRAAILDLHDTTEGENSYTQYLLTDDQDEPAVDIVVGQIRQTQIVSQYFRDFMFTPSQEGYDDLFFGIHARKLDQRVAILGTVDSQPKTEDEATITLLSHGNNVFATPLTGNVPTSAKVFEETLGRERSRPQILTLIAVAKAVQEAKTKPKTGPIKETIAGNFGTIALKPILKSWPK